MVDWEDFGRRGTFRRERQPSFYDVAQVCAQGHVITTFAQTSPQTTEKFCSRCGSETFMQCPSCKADVPGHYHVDGVLHHGDPIPNHCKSCGEAYPWADKIKLIGGAEPDSLESLQRIFNKFDSVARQLKHRHDARDTLLINDEYDVQDLLHALLKLYYQDIREEESSPSRAGANTRLDFLLKGERTVIEVKKTREGLRDKKLGEELILDISRYRQHPDCGTLIFFVYDPGRELKNPRGLERDLASSEKDLKVRVYIRPES